MVTPQILFQNLEYVFINKPAGWLSIPAREPKTEDRVANQWLAETLGVQIFIVHRLDRFTTGVMMFALSAEAHRTANAWFENRANKNLIKKTYLFLAAPPPSRPAIKINTPIDEKPAQTLFEVIKKNSEFFFGRAVPKTGRFHQIREHAKVAGFPLLGDKKLGSKIPFERVALHAFELKTPAGTYQAPVPADFTDKIKELET